jgi:PTS system sucrose-specific IIC component
MYKRIHQHTQQVTLQYNLNTYFLTACIGGGIGGAVTGGIGHIGAKAIGPSGVSLFNHPTNLSVASPLLFQINMYKRIHQHTQQVTLQYNLAGLLAAYAGGFVCTYLFGTTKAMRQTDLLGD